MVDEISITEVAEALARVQTNYSNLAQSWYNIFYNTTPMDVQVEFYDVNGEAQTYIIPNRAKDKTYFTNGEFADPTNNVSAPIGTIYQSTVTGDVYVKMIGEGATGWIKIISQSDLDKIIVQKSGDPNATGEVRAFGTLYIDISTGYMYMRRPESKGEYKWDRIDSYSTALLSETFTITEETQELVLNGICQSKEVLSVYENGILLNPNSYSMPYNDNRTVRLANPIIVPPSEESVEVVIRYFIDTHVAETTAQADMLNYVLECKKYAIGEYDPETGEDQSCKWYYMQMKDIKLDLEEQIAGIDHKYNECKDALDYYYEQYHDEFLRIQRETVNYIDSNAEQFTAGVTKVYNYSVQVAEQTEECTKMYENCKLAEMNTLSYADYVRYTVQSLATKAEVEEVRVSLTNNIDDTRAGLTTFINQNVEVINNSIEETSTNILAQLETEVEQITATYNNLYDYTTNQINTVNSWIEVHEDLADFQNETGFIREDNFPIDVNGIYKYERTVAPSTDILVTVEKSCSYYSVDLGEVMNEAQSDLEFTFDIEPGNTINTGMIDDLVNYDNIVSCIRVFLKNGTDFTPSVKWHANKISWLGEAPELEVYKDYIVEFISTDMMGSWKAHVLGICQPAIDIAPFDTTFNIVCPAITDDATLATQPVSVSMTVDGFPRVIDEQFFFDTTTNAIEMNREIENEFKNSLVTNLNVRCPGVPKFTRYYSTQEFTLTPDGTYSVVCDTPITEQHTYALTVRCAEIEEYLKTMESGDEINMATIQAKFKFDWGMTTTAMEATYYYDSENEPNSGAVFTFDNTVIPDAMAGEADNYIRGIKLTRDAGTTCYVTDEPIVIDIVMDGGSSTSADKEAAEGAWEDDTIW